MHQSTSALALSHDGTSSSSRCCLVGVQSAVTKKEGNMVLDDVQLNALECQAGILGTNCNTWCLTPIETIRPNRDRQISMSFTDNKDSVLCSLCVWWGRGGGGGRDQQLVRALRPAKTEETVSHSQTNNVTVVGGQCATTCVLR